MPSASATAKSGTVRLAPLDAMRGVAALGVSIFSHYKHFGGDQRAYPWAASRWAEWAYDHGWLLVDLFFLLSGIVFTYRYFEPLAQKRTSARDFLVLRLSRLYPLHLLTLLYCAAIEWRCIALKQPEIIYDHNNLFDFFIHLFYLQSGWFEEAWSYDAPSWSVAVEVAVYVLFFIYASKGRSRYLAASACTFVIGMAVIRQDFRFPIVNQNMARGAVGFFFGSLLFFGLQKLKEGGHQRPLTIGAFAALVSLFGLTYLLGIDAFIGGSPLTYAIAVFPIIIVAGLEVPFFASILSFRPLTFLGDISYAIYLVHVPIQMTLLLILRVRGETAPSESKLFFLQYVILILVVATLVHKLFEVPARAWLRDRLMARPLPTAK